MVKIDKNARSIMLTAIISILVTNPVSIMITNTINGPAPGLAVNSVSFAQDISTKVVLDDDLLASINNLLITESLEKYCDYKTLYDEYNQMASMSDDIESSIVQAKQWISNEESKSQDYLPTDEVLNSPFVNFRAMRDVTLHILGDKSIEKKVPTEASVIAKRKENAIPFFVQSGYVGFRLKSHDMILANMERLTVAENSFINSLLLSYVYGRRDNIVYFTKLYINNAASYELKYKEVSEKVRAILLNDAKIEAVVTLYNNGHMPVIFTPIFALRIRHEKYMNQPMRLSVIGSDKPTIDEEKEVIGSVMQGYVDKLMNSLSTMDSSAPLRISPDSSSNHPQLFPDMISSSHISLQPGETRVLKLIASSSSINGNELFDLYQSNLLKCVIAGITTSGRIIKSDGASFGQSSGNIDNDSMMKAKW